jgi:hypothetical protein
MPASVLEDDPITGRVICRPLLVIVIEVLNVGMARMA